jgi:hypothetical protein
LVLVAGDTGAVPAEATEPTPGSIVTDVAFDTFQPNVEEPPVAIIGGLATK